MDNISVIASLVQLVVFRLFLITCPAEGYVSVRSDWLDWSDQGLQSSPWKRQIEPIMSDTERQNDPTRTDVMKPEMERDGELMYGSEDNNELPSQDEIFNKYEASVNQVSTDDQNAYVKKRDVEKIVPMSDGIKEKDLLLTNGQSKENGSRLTAHNTAAIIILPIPSRL